MMKRNQAQIDAELMRLAGEETEYPVIEKPKQPQQSGHPVVKWGDLTEEEKASGQYIILNRKQRRAMEAQRRKS